MLRQREILGKIIANNIKSERNKASLTQEEVANQLDITLRTYISYEKNAKHIDFFTIASLADIFHCTIDDFCLYSNFTQSEYNLNGPKN